MRCVPQDPEPVRLKCVGHVVSGHPLISVDRVRLAAITSRTSTKGSGYFPTVETRVRRAVPLERTEVLSQQDGSASFGAVFRGGYGDGDDHEPGSRAVVLQGQHHKQTRPRLDYQNQATEVMLSMSPPRPRVDEMPPSSAPETSPRTRGPFVASWPIFAPARGFGDAAGAAEAHRAAADPARRRSEERPRAWRPDGIDA